MDNNKNKEELFEYEEATGSARIKKDDKRNESGDEKLFNRNEWVPASELDNEKKILAHPIMHEAFDRILQQHVPKQHTAFLSLCTATRPYYKSKKWKAFIEHFGGKVDMIVVSNGGMIPQPFWKSYPYLNYDGGDHDDIKLYQDIMYDRMLRFFKTHNYKYVLANFRPNLINAKPAEESLVLLKSQNYIEDYVVMPDEATYKLAQQRGFKPPHGQGDMFPDLTETVMEALLQQVEDFGYDTSLLTLGEKFRYGMGDG